MKSVKTSEMRKVSGGCYVEVCPCGKKSVILGPITFWMWATNHAIPGHYVNKTK